MDITIRSSALREELALLGRVVPKKHPVAPLVNARMAADDGVLRLVGTDARVGLATLVTGASISTGGAALVPVDKLADLLRTMPDADVSLVADGDTVRVRANGYRCELRSLPVEDYPAMPAPADDDASTRMPADTLRRLLRRTRFAVSTRDDPRGFTTSGALLTSDEHGVSIVATDGHRLSWARADLAGAPPLSVVLSAQLLDVLASILESADGHADVVFGGRHVFVTAGGRRAFGQLLEGGSFPKWQPLVADVQPYRAQVDRASLADALTRARMVASGDARTVLAFEPGLLRIGAESQSGRGEEELSTPYDGPPVKVALNAAYVLEWLASLQTGDVWICIKDSAAPVRMSATDMDLVCTYMVMPVRL